MRNFEKISDGNWETIVLCNYNETIKILYGDSVARFRHN